MSSTDGERRRTHLHGLAAGSLLVLATFLAWTVPSAIVRLVKGDVSPDVLVYPALFALLLGGSIREALAWDRGAPAASPAAA